VKIIGWKKGKERVMVTDDPVKLTMFAEIMDRTEYMDEQQKGEK